jgi:hypothetical protein
MFCPRCGCHASPDGSRFCRNCGFRLDGVAQLLARNGAPEGYIQPQAVVPIQPSPRKKGLKKGGKILFGAVAFFPLFFGFCFLVNSGGPLVVPAFVFFAGLMRMLYARIFEDAEPEFPTAFQPFVQPVAIQPQPVSFLPSNYQPPLGPPQTNVPTTGNLVAPPSVSEPTTSLLKQR